MTYSGETLVTIRSGKHDSSSAESHVLDLDKFLNMEEMKDKFKTPCGEIKPVLINSKDHGPDEKKNIKMGCATKNNLDCYMECTNAPGLSAYNPVERKMYHLNYVRYNFTT